MEGAKSFTPVLGGVSKLVKGPDCKSGGCAIGGSTPPPTIMTGLSFSAVSVSEVVITGPEALYQWRENHRLPVPGHEFTPQFRKKRWDGTWAPGSFCRQRGDVFDFRCSRGLLPRVVKDFGGQLEFNVAPDDQIDAFCTHTTKVSLLRDYQLQALRTILKVGWGRVAFATNAGKGAVIALLARFAASQGHHVLICCDEKGVFDALEGEIITWNGITPGVVKSGVKSPPWDSAVTLAMIPTLSRRLNADEDKDWHRWMERQGMLLLDEADKADSASWRTVIDSAKNSAWRAGFSGTFPDELIYDLKFDELMGPVVLRIPNSVLIERGISAKPEVEIHLYDCTAFVQSLPKKDWWATPSVGRRNLVYERAVIENQSRHNFIASLIVPDTPTAIVVNRVDHGHNLSLTIPGSVFLDGSVGDRERIEALEEFKRGEIKVLIITKILDRGTNRLGHAADLIFASGEGSTKQTLQRIGRGLRRADGKEYLRLVDIVDRIDTDGADRRIKSAAAFLHSAVRRRLEVYNEEGFDIKLVPYL